MMLVSDNINLI